jgi:hypothetical protein
MRVTYEGADYDFDMADVTVKQAIKIEKHLGFPFAEFGAKLEAGEADMRAIQAFGWLILFGGRDIPIEDADFKVLVLSAALEAAAKAEAAADAAAGQETGDAEVLPTAAAVPVSGSVNGLAVVAGAGTGGS